MTTTTYPTPPARRIGVINPYDFALDRELWRWVPDDVTLHMTRLPAASPDVTVDMVTRLGEPDLVRAATRQITTVKPDVIAYACTSASFVRGHSGERRLRETMIAAGAPQAVTTSGAVIEALGVLGARRVAIATPYTRELSVLLSEFLRAVGYEVSGVANLGMHQHIWALTYPDVSNLIRDAGQHGGDAIVVSCTNVPTYDVIAPLERELGVPIVSANQATMWAALRRVGRAPIGTGQLLFDAAEPEQGPKARYLA